MRILLINPAHPAIGSRIPDEHLPPLGLLAVGGPLLDDGHEVQLLDAEFGPLAIARIVERAVAWAPDAVLVGHSGSTSGHPIVCELTRALREALPVARIVYGGVFPTFHWREALLQEPQIDVIVRGEGEETARRLMHALREGSPLEDVQGIAFRREGAPVATAPAPLIQDLDAYRVGWELIDPARYSYWGGKRAVVVQFSRGCPHGCTYCGQRAFWVRWRHRDPKRFAAEIAWLHRTHGVEVFNFADEDPTASRPAWRAFLEALIAEDVCVKLVGSTRAGDIVRDADILHLYKRAGVERWLLGIENCDEAMLTKIRKGSTTANDREAIGLLRQHGILSLATWVVGLTEGETGWDFWHGLRQLMTYDPDQTMIVFATPHRWTPYFEQQSERRVVETDLRRWDYKHQVLASGRMAPWRVLLWTKAIEVIMQLRPRAVWRAIAHRDRAIRAAHRWYYRMGLRVWPHEVREFLTHRRRRGSVTLAEFWGGPGAEAAAAVAAAPSEALCAVTPQVEQEEERAVRR